MFSGCSLLTRNWESPVDEHSIVATTADKPAPPTKTEQEQLTTYPASYTEHNDEPTPKENPVTVEESEEPTVEVIALAKPNNQSEVEVIEAIIEQPQPEPEIILMETPVEGSHEVSEAKEEKKTLPKVEATAKTRAVMKQKTTVKPVTSKKTPKTKRPQKPTVKLVKAKSISKPAMALVIEAKKSVKKGKLERAAALLERALRIEKKNASLWHDLAQVRMGQGKYDQAINIAAKSNSLARNNAALRKRNNKLIKVAKSNL